MGWASQTDPTAFRSDVLAYHDTAGLNPFHKLAVDVLSLSHSNTEEERVFSQLSVVKTKHRNSLSTASTSAVLSIRRGLRLLGKCCYTYDLHDTVTRKVGTMQAYSSALLQEAVHVCKAMESLQKRKRGEVELLLYLSYGL